jgi:hypothetical protein
MRVTPAGTRTTLYVPLLLHGWFGIVVMLQAD